MATYINGKGGWKPKGDTSPPPANPARVEDFLGIYSELDGKPLTTPAAAKDFLDNKDSAPLWVYDLIGLKEMEALL